MSDAPTIELRTRPIVILGPTAGGKSDLAITLAERLNGEVIGADSMQVYRHLDAGTAKPTREQRGRVPHHLIDIIEPTERFTVADWLERADALITDLRARAKRPIVVGGTNLYLKALLEGLFDGPEHDADLRDRLDAAPNADLYERLREVDPPSADRIHPNDHKKLVRAVEVFELTGRPISDWQRQWENEQRDRPYRHEPVLVGLHWPAEAINPRINLRVKAMFHPEAVDPALAWAVCINGDPPESLPAEVERLEAAGLLGEQARQALGYKQVLASLAREYTLADAFEQTKIQTRRFAKNQRTWLRRFRGVAWLEAADNGPEAIADRAISAVTASTGHPPE